MLQSSLDVPDKLSEHDELHHNPAVACLLGHAYSCLRQAAHAEKAYTEAYGFAEACFPLAMSDRQRMRVHYAFGSALLGLEHFREGITSLNEAIEYAARLPDPGAYAELAYLAAAASGRVFSYLAATEYGMIAYGVLRSLATDGMTVDADLEIDVLVGLAGSEFALARYAAAAQHLTLARQLTGSSSHQSLSVASIAWMEALLHRWRGQPELALHLAMAVTDIYAQIAQSPTSILSIGRVSGIVSEVALDLAQSLPSGDFPSARASYLQLADPYVKHALHIAKETSDRPGLSLAMLTQARYDGVAGHNVNRIDVIEAVIKQAQQENDIALLAQAYTGLAREYTVLGHTEAALNCYRRSLDTVAGTDVQAVGAFAWRSLLFASEMQE